MAKNFIKIGSVKNNEFGTSVSLGNWSNDPRYKTSTQVIVRDHAGNVLIDQTDGFLSVFDPRVPAPGGEPISEAQLARLDKAGISKELFAKVKQK